MYHRLFRALAGLALSAVLWLSAMPASAVVSPVLSGLPPRPEFGLKQSEAAAYPVGFHDAFQHRRVRGRPIQRAVDIVSGRKPRAGRPRSESDRKADASLGGWIAKRRTARGMPLAELAAAVGLTEAQMAAAEAGELRLGAARLRRLARALDIPLTSFGQEAETPPPDKRALDMPRGRRSIFQEDWWLDAVTGGNWTSVSAGTSPDCAAWLPLWPVRRSGQRLLAMPPLTRTLGPVVTLVEAKTVSDRAQRCELLQQIIDRLPPHDVFHQVFDCAFDDAFAFAASGFTVYAQYTFTLDAARPLDALWAGLKDKVRNRIRRGSERLTLDRDLGITGFYDFYERNLKRRGLASIDDLAISRLATMEAVRHGACAIYAARNQAGRLAAAILLVWDERKMYYLQSSRDETEADSTAVSFLLWRAIESAHERRLVFDFDGFATRGGALFVSAFGGVLAQRPVVQGRRV